MGAGPLRSAADADDDAFGMEPLSEINVTPLVDVMLVLLIIFMVAALEGRGESPTWLVTGTDAEGAEAAAESLDEVSLSNRFAIAVPAGGEPLRLPVP
jgi:biopolymer transport protein ExbD